MKFHINSRFQSGFVICSVLTFCLVAGSQNARGANATTLDTDPNPDGLGFGLTDAFTFGGAFGQDGTAVFNGNDILVQVMDGSAAGGSGAGISVPISNGENGIDQSLDGVNNEIVNIDIPNATPPNPVFAAIGNASGKLENGNVLRYSMWVRSDPAFPATLAPQIEPVVKFELWKEALSTNADTGGGQVQPFFGDKVYDTDQHLNAGIWIDIDNNGGVIDTAAASTGRIRTVNTTSWTLIEAVYEVDDSQWLGIGDDLYTVEDIEEVRAVMFWGDFVGTDLTGGGALWFDNLLFEVFKDAASITPNTNPDPVLSEGPGDGDFDGDGDVDGRDFLIWQRGGSPNMLSAGDLALWQNTYGNGALAALNNVPEPGTACLAAIALSLMGCRRRVRRM